MISFPTGDIEQVACAQGRPSTVLGQDRQGPKALGLLRVGCAVVVLIVSGCTQASGPPGTPDAPAEPPPSVQAKPGKDDTARSSKRTDRRPRDQGRWGRVRASAETDPGLQTQIRQLEALGYASGTKTAPSLVGVTVHVRGRVSPGLNLYTSGHQAEAELITTDGRVVHRWAYDFFDVWPDDETDPRIVQTQYWRRAHVFENGDLLAIYEGLGLIKVDKDSNLLWARRNGAHHDLQILANGDIAVLTRKARPSHFDPRKAILEDFAEILGSDGRSKARYSLLESFKRSPQHSKVWENAEKRGGDVFHTNSIEVLDGRFAEEHPAFASGNLLLSSRALNTVFIVRPSDNRVVWALRAGFRAQHDARVLDDGDLMLFDNRGRQNASAVQIYDPTTHELKWEYRGTKEHPFYTRSCGAAQRLPNGNTLVTESDNGRAFEIAPDETIVWEFYNPHRAGENDQYIATLFLVERLPAGFPTNWTRAPAAE